MIDNTEGEKWGRLMKNSENKRYPSIRSTHELEPRRSFLFFCVFLRRCVTVFSGAVVEGCTASMRAVFDAPIFDAPKCRSR